MEVSKQEGKGGLERLLSFRQCLKEMKINMLREDWGSEPYGRLSGTRHTGLDIGTEMAYEEREITAHKNGP